MIKKLGLFLLVSILYFSLGIIPVSSVEIVSCTSNGEEGICEIGRTCICSVSGDCTNGNLLLFEGELGNPVCSPSIVGGEATIYWDYCEVEEGSFLDAIADCEEGQSTPVSIRVSAPETTTTSVPTTSTTTSTPIEVTETTRREEKSVEECGINGYCEDYGVSCQPGYERCPEYDGECPGLRYCCCLIRRGLCIGGICLPEEVDETLVFLSLLAVILAVAVFFFFTKMVGKGTSFEKLYEKWARILYFY